MEKNDFVRAFDPTNGPVTRGGDAGLTLAIPFPLPSCPGGYTLLTSPEEPLEKIAGLKILHQKRFS